MRLILRRFLTKKRNFLGTAIVGLFFVTAAFAPLLSPATDPANPEPIQFVGEPNQNALPQPPNSEAPLGTTGINVDVYHALVWGTQSALRFGLTVAVFTALLGTVMGLVSGYAGGIVEQLLIMMTDAFLVFPPIAAFWLFSRVLLPGAFNPAVSVASPPLLAAIRTILAWLRLDIMALVFILFFWSPYARLVNASVSQVKQAPFIEVARSLGATNKRILFQHILPNAVPSAIVLAARDISGMVILAAAFNFIGLGGNVVWGRLLALGSDYIIGISGNPLIYWWVWLPASLALIIFSIGWNLLGDSLQIALDPRV